MSPIQAASIPVILAGGNALLLAPTGYGKTEAALLPVLHLLLEERDRRNSADKPWPEGFKVLYITPLRALNRDLLRRLQEWVAELEFTIGVRHGDTSQAERSRQARKPPDILITTPETLQLILYGDVLRRHLATVRFVIVDEIHDLATNERGAQLMVALERVEEVIAQPESLRLAKAGARKCPREPHATRPGFQRIGLSATVAESGEVAAFLSAATKTVRADAQKAIDLRVEHPVVDDAAHLLAGQLSITPLAAAQLAAVRAHVLTHERTIVFSNTRDGAEVISSRSALCDSEGGGPLLLGLHHGSLSAEHREEMEDGFRRGDIRGIVATSSLELGIDVGAIDHVLQVHSPRSVARMVQRLGRAGHRIGATSAGTLLSSGPEDHLECVAVARMAASGSLEPATIRDNPLVVLANQLIAMSNEYAELDPGWAEAVLRRSWPFHDLDEGMFRACWDTLIDVKTVFESEHHPGTMGRSGRGRRHFLKHISLIPDRKTYHIFDEAGKRTIGAVDDAYVAAALHPGDHFVMAGRPWRVLEVDADARRVRVAPTKDLGAVPQWSGQALPVSAMLAAHVAVLRGTIGLDACPDDLLPASAPVRAHLDAGLIVATDLRITVDAGRGGLVVSVPLGTKGNEALGRITAGLLHQRFGTAVGLETDAYRIHLRTPPSITGAQVIAMWGALEVDSIDTLLAIVLRDQPVVKHHLVHVAKHFGAVPDELDPNRFTKTKMSELWNRLALQEETISRLLHDRFDMVAVGAFLERLQAGEFEIVHQAMGPLSRVGGDEAKLMLAPRSDAQLLEQVRRRIESTDVMMVCTQCRSRLDMQVIDVARRPHCRRCSSAMVACLRPYQAEHLRVLANPDQLTADEKRLRRNFERNAQIVAGFGSVAARCLAARGVGPDTATRILQKAADPADPAFWREVLAAELAFAETSSYWQK